MIAAFASDNATTPACDCLLADADRLLQLTPRNTEPFVCIDTYEHRIRTTTQIIDGVLRMTVTDLCCGVEAVHEQTLTELIVGQGAGDAADA